MIRINDTLLTKLFLEPNPQPNNPEVIGMFNRLNYRMFPGKKDFVHFLQTQNIDEQYKYSEKIIHHLCYNSNYPPPFFSIKDIICIEEYQKELTNEHDSYIPRNHFIHLLYLYLLGIYIFFYNTEFYNRIIKDNRYEREDMYYQQKFDPIKDFISEWKYFCLYHDIGYTSEIFSNPEKIRNARQTFNDLCKNANDFQKSFLDKIPTKQISFFGTIEIMSKIFVTKFIVEYSKERITEDNKMFKKFRISNLSLFSKNGFTHNVNFENAVNGIFSNVIKLEKVFTNHCLKSLMPILGSNNIYVIGTHKDTGEVSFISFVKANQRYLILLSKYLDNYDIKKILDNPSLILFDDFSFENFEVEYFLANNTTDNNYNNFLKSNKEYIELSFEILKSDLNEKFISVSNEVQLLDFFFDVYLNLYESFHSSIFPTKTPKRYSNEYAFDKFINNVNINFISSESYNIEDWEKLTQIIYSIIQDSYIYDVKQFCIDYIQNINFEIVSKKNVKNTVEMVESIINMYFLNVSEQINDKNCNKILMSKIKENYANKMEQKASLIKLYAIIYSGLKSIFNNKKNFPYKFSYEKRQEIFKSAFYENNISNKTKKNFDADVNEIENSYEIPYGNKIDHGIASAKYAASVFSTLRELIECSKNDNETQLINILFSISNTNSFDKCIYQYIGNYNHIFKNVLYAIFIHNIYPDKFKSNKLRSMQTNITTDPFAYLALLSDALQQWNRPQSISPSLIDIRSNEYASSEYNILVNNEKIIIYEQNTEKSQQRLTDNIKNLSYLSNISAFLKNGYSMKYDK